MIGHSELECSKPAIRNQKRKLPYDVPLRAPDEKRRRIQSFGGAAAESFGNGLLLPARSHRSQSRSGGGRSSLGDESSHQSSSERVVATEEEEVVSTLKK